MLLLVLKGKKGALISLKKKRGGLNIKYTNQSQVVNAGPFNQFMPAQQIDELTLDEEGEVIEMHQVFDFEKYSQPGCLHSEISDKLKEIVSKNPTVKVSFGKVNLARVNVSAFGHMLVYFSTPDFVWYINLQQINEGIGRAVYDSLDEIFNFYSKQAPKHRITRDTFSPFDFFVPIGP